MNNQNTNIERIIAKIDNDFNPDNSDWIPRVGAWCIDAMSMLNSLPTERKKRKLIVKDRIAYSSCNINTSNLVLYDENNCKINKAKDRQDCCGSHSTGESTSETSGSNCEFTPDTINIVTHKANKVPIYSKSNHVNSKDYSSRYNVIEIDGDNIKGKSYYIIDSNKIELNWDTDYVYIESDEIVTECSSLYGCELPVIPNNGILIEAIAYYCIYKMLCRGYKHPVFNLNASQYGTNPYYMWTQLKEEARRSVLNNNFDADSSKLFRSNLFIETFDPR